MEKFSNTRICVVAIRRDISSKYYYAGFSAETRLTSTHRIHYLTKYGLSRQGPANPFNITLNQNPFNCYRVITW